MNSPVFQPLDISINQTAKRDLRQHYNDWYSGEVTKQLLRGVGPADVKVSLGLTKVNPLHVIWITEVYKSLVGKKESIVNGFRSAGIQEAVFAPDNYSKNPNPFRPPQ